MGFASSRGTKQHDTEAHALCATTPTLPSFCHPRQLLSGIQGLVFFHAGFRPRTTRSFCFGKRTQNHWRPGVAPRGCLCPSPDCLGCGTRFAQTVLAPKIEFSGLGRSHARRRRRSRVLVNLSGSRFQIAPQASLTNRPSRSRTVRGISCPPRNSCQVTGSPCAKREFLSCIAVSCGSKGSSVP